VSSTRVAVLGGDSRELYIAAELASRGHEVRYFGSNDNGAAGVQHCASPEEAVQDAHWIVCPSPGLGAGDQVYAPFSTQPIVLAPELLGRSDASLGGIVLGRATPTLVATAAALSIDIFEMKDDRSLAISNATSVAEALVSLLVTKTTRVLTEYRILVVGYGATGAALTDALLGLACRPSVAAARPEHLSRIRQRGAVPVPYEQRVDAMAESDIVVNTVPSVDAVPPEAFAALRRRLVVDIASPPGGMDHDAATAADVDVTWARGLAGARAPHSAGDAQLRTITAAIDLARSRERSASAD